jgi:PTS system galactosamine-specific IIB component
LTIPNILLTRIDNRLVHGQVGVTWVKSLGANLIVVVDDEVANDPLQQQLMKMTAEMVGVGIRFFTIEHTINIIHKASPSQKIFIVCKTPQVVRKLIDGGVPIKKVNVGNMHFSPGKRQLSKKVYVDEKDLEDLHYIRSKGVEVYIQDTPDDKKEYFQ